MVGLCDGMIDWAAIVLAIRERMVPRLNSVASLSFVLRGSRTEWKAGNLALVLTDTRGIVMDENMVGGIVGSVIGVVGGIIGTYFSIRNTAGPRERRFMIQVAVAAWLLVTAFVIAFLMLPRPFNFLLWLPYGVALPLGIIWCNRRQLAIRAEESAADPTLR